MKSRRVHLIAVASACLAMSGCGWFNLGGDGANPSSNTQQQVFQAPVSVSDFCDQMLSIRDDALDPDSTITNADLIGRYEAALEIAPAEVVPDLEILLEELRTGTSTENTSTVEGDGGLDLPGEVWTPDDTASGRVFDYVDSACAGTSSNPGPAATAPN